MVIKDQKEKKVTNKIVKKRVLRKKTKFNVGLDKKGIKNRTYDGILFSSVLEMKYYRDYLIPLREKGEIANIVLQPSYVIQDSYIRKDGKKILPIRYVADFDVLYSDGTFITVDVKGKATIDAKMKRKIFECVYPDKSLQWIGYSKQDGGWVDYDLIQYNRRQRKINKRNKNGES